MNDATHCDGRDGPMPAAPLAGMLWPPIGAPESATAMLANLSPPVARLVLLALTAGLVCACAQAPATGGPAPVPNIFETQRSIDEYVDSGRYAADVADVVKQAQAWLDERAPAVTKPAIVLDIDETALSNWPAYRVNGWVRVLAGDCDLESGPCNIRKWQEMGRSPALPATLELARHAHDHGVAVFFVTGRPASLQEATERNLRNQGYAFERLYLRPSGAYLSAAQFKAPIRCALEREGYHVVLALGDQRSDLDGGCTERGFKLPNPVYFLP